jgi:hypothetical protein
VQQPSIFFSIVGGGRRHDAQLENPDRNSKKEEQKISPRYRG